MLVTYMRLLHNNELEIRMRAPLVAHEKRLKYLEDMLIRAKI